MVELDMNLFFVHMPVNLRINDFFFVKCFESILLWMFQKSKFVRFLGFQILFGTLYNFPILAETIESSFFAQNEVATG